MDVRECWGKELGGTAPGPRSCLIRRASLDNEGDMALAMLTLGFLWVLFTGFLGTAIIPLHRAGAIGRDASVREKRSGINEGGLIIALELAQSRHWLTGSTHSFVRSVSQSVSQVAKSLFCSRVTISYLTSYLTNY